MQWLVSEDVTRSRIIQRGCKPDPTRPVYSSLALPVDCEAEAFDVCWSLPVCSGRNSS